MKANELKIGSYYNFSEDVVSVSFGHTKTGIRQLTEQDIYWIMEDVGAKSFDELIDEIIKPIPLTEELIIKLGFEIEEEETLICDEDSTILTSTLFFKPLNEHIKFYCDFIVNHAECYLSNKFVLARPKFVHQLQNLYFALTKDELQIK